MRRKVPCVLRLVPSGGCLLCGCGTAWNRETGVGAVPVVVALPPVTAVGTRLGTALSPQRSPPLPLCSPRLIFHCPASPEATRLFSVSETLSFGNTS